jgi:sugar phosphate permease
VSATVHRYRWVILAVGLGAQTAISALRQGLPSLGPALRGELDLSLPQVGLIFSSVSLGIVVTLIAWGALADRIGERPVIAVGLTGTAVALVGAAFADGYTTLLLCLLAAGMFGASATGASGRAVMGWFGRRERGMALGVRQMGVPLGGGIAAATLPLLAAASGLEGAMLALAGGCLLAAGAALVWMREAPPPPADRPKTKAPPPLRDRRLWRLASGGALLVVAQSGVLGFVVLFLHDERGWSPAAAAAALGFIQVSGAIVRVLVGRISDRRERRIDLLRRLPLASSVLLLAAAALEAGPIFLLLPALLAGGVLAMSWNGLSFTAAGEMSGRERAGLAMSVQNTVLSAGGVIAPIAFAVVVSATDWPIAWALLACSQLAGVWVLRPLVGEEERRARARERSGRTPAATVSPS